MGKCNTDNVTLSLHDARFKNIRKTSNSTLVLLLLFHICFRIFLLLFNVILMSSDSVFSHYGDDDRHVRILRTTKPDEFAADRVTVAVLCA